MYASQKHANLGGSNTLGSLPVQETGSYYLAPTQNIDNQRVWSDEGSQGSHFSVHASDPYCALESSTATGGYPSNNSPSTVSFSSNGSPTSHPDSHSYLSDPHHSPDNTYTSRVNRSFLSDNVDDLTRTLRELETAMLADTDIMESYDISVLDGGGPTQIPSETDRWNPMMEMISGGDLKGVLAACAKAVGDNDLVTAEWLMSHLRPMVSVSGEPLQRLGAYMLEGLVARLANSGSSIYRALKCKEPTGNELLSYMHLLYEVCPYFKFGYMSANGAIAEAVKDEKAIHIIDFQICQGTQWFTLIQALAARPGGPPRIRITGIDDSTSAYARGGGLDLVGQRLRRLAESFKVPFEFHAAALSGTEVEIQDLGVRPGEALAVNFPMVLHHMPDESVGTHNHRDRLLRLVKSLGPKVVTLIEQESNTNTAPFYHRFLETLEYYLALFESIDVTLSREHKERINVEQHCLAREIVNIIACEGAERVERHEVLGKWKSRFLMAGFKPYPLSPYVNGTIKNLLESYCENYSLHENDGALYLGWKSRDLVVSCAWK